MPRKRSGPSSTDAVNKTFNNQGVTRSGAARNAAIASRWASVDEAAALLGISPNAVWALARFGQIPSHFPGAGHGDRMLLRRDVEIYAARRDAALALAAGDAPSITSVEDDEIEQTDAAPQDDDQTGSADDVEAVA